MGCLNGQEPSLVSWMSSCQCLKIHTQDITTIFRDRFRKLLFFFFQRCISCKNKSGCSLLNFTFIMKLQNLCRMCVYVCEHAGHSTSICYPVCSGGGGLKLEEMDEPGSDPRLSCDPYITFYCINFLPNVTKYWIQYFSHTVPLSVTHTKKDK